MEAAKTLTLKAVYSRSLKSAKTITTDSANVDLYSGDSGSGKSLDDLLARSDIHAVIIALPIKNQPDYIRKSLLAGKHVLSEKPVAENVKDAKDLIKWYRSEVDTKKVTWGVAENVRYLATSDHAAEARKKMGKVLGFRVRMQAMVKGGKYFETEYVPMTVCCVLIRMLNSIDGAKSPHIKAAFFWMEVCTSLPD